MYSHKPALLSAVLLICGLFLYGSPKTWYVSTNGNNSDPGTEAQPFADIPTAITAASAGDTILVRGGTYPSAITISITKSGTEDSYFTLKSYPGERAILDFSLQAFGGSNRGFMITGSYWHIEGFDVCGAGDNGMKIDEGIHNRIVNCAFYRNRDTGLQMGAGASYNEVINCDSYFNADPTDYGDADGFAAKLDVGVENYFFGCRAWMNCDDGWDGYMRGADNASTILENCWAFANGYLEDGTDPGAQANGNGFKMGGSDDKDLSHDFTLKNCLSFNNKAKGFDQNSNMGSMILYNCSGYNNLQGNYVIYKTLADGKVLIIKNSLVLGELGNLADFAVQESNSWLAPFEVTGEDFLSLDPEAASGPRDADGNLPEIVYMHLAEGSDLIDGGVDVGLSYNGDAPDLGCFESGEPDPSGILEENASFELMLYPNPASTYINLSFAASAGENYRVEILDLGGRIILQTELGEANEAYLTTGLSVDNLRNGVYVCRISSAKGQLGQRLLLIQN